MLFLFRMLQNSENSICQNRLLNLDF